jgi:uracil-DNA glycosylase family 4
MEKLKRLGLTVADCRRCPRLVRWREQSAKAPPRRHRGELYWARPVPGFGDPDARLLVVGLAPAAHGGNRTGRIFTGDRSGDWLYEALYAFGFSNQPESTRLGDGLELRDCYVTAAVHCAPPANKPAPPEFDRCRPYLVEELRLLDRVRVVVALGRIAFDSFLRAHEERGGKISKPKPRFSHGGSVTIDRDLTLIASYHPSQQNTFTGKLTRIMFHAVFREARRRIVDGSVKRESE